MKHSKLQVLQILAFTSAAHTAPTHSSAAKPNYLGNNQGNWSTVKCTDAGSVDSSTDPGLRWSEVDAAGAWDAVTLYWNQDAPILGDSRLPFPETVSNFFNGPEQWNCQDIGNIACSTTVECVQTDHPAGWFILNSFSRLHQINQEINTALLEAEQDMQGNIGSFTSTFAPQMKDGISFVKELLDILALCVGVTSAYSWNLVISQIMTNVGTRSFSKDSFNNAIAFVINSVKDNIPAAKSALGQQNQMNEALTSYFNVWQTSQSEYVNSIFSGSSQTLSQLDSLISDGKMNTASGTPNLDSLKGKIESVMYAQMIQTAWKNGPTTLYPFILETTDPCTSKAGTSVQGFMSDNTAAQTHVCWNDKTYYVLNANYLPPVTCSKDYCNTPIGYYQFSELPGGTFNTLSGGNFGGVRLDDMVISSYQGYQLNGNANGYAIPDMSNLIDGAGNTGNIYQNEIQTPGFFSLPICPSSSITDVLRRISGDEGAPKGQYWPCS